jgi:hypothetical protein
MRLVIIDPSLGDPHRGHPRHAQHASVMARAAIARGGAVVIGAHRDYVPEQPDLVGLSVERVFPESVYWRWDGTEVPYQPSRLTLSPADVQARVQGFTAACATLFDRVGIEPGQIVYLPMASEFHLLGLSQLIAQRADAHLASWHVQFHFQILHGDPSGYAAQVDRSDAVREVLAEALAGSRRAGVFLYTTNDCLTDQFQRLGVADVWTLPQTTCPSFHPIAAPHARPRLLRLTVAGALRKSKMWAYEAMIVALQPRLRAGDVQVVVQVPPSHPMCPKRSDAWRTAAGPLVCAPFPMPLEEYAALVRDTHIGLLPYDAAVYYARSSAVLAEMLSAGVPVLLPARCGLAATLPVISSGRVGRTFDALETVGVELNNLIEHWLEYKVAAVEASRAYRAHNAPEAVLRMFESRSAHQVAGTSTHDHAPVARTEAAAR